jgi:hypothetical protein
LTQLFEALSRQTSPNIVSLKARDLPVYTPGVLNNTGINNGNQSNGSSSMLLMGKRQKSAALTPTKPVQVYHKI